MIYKVETIKDGTEKYFFIRNLETMSIEELPSKYLMHKIKCKRSLQIPLHRITDSASNGSVFPVVTEHFSASSDHAFL